MQAHAEGISQLSPSQHLNGNTLSGPSNNASNPTPGGIGNGQKLRRKLDFLYWNIYVHYYSLRHRDVSVAGGMTTVLRARRPSDTGKIVRYTPCNRGDQTDEEELEEIEVLRTEVNTHTNGSTPSGASNTSGGNRSTVSAGNRSNGRTSGTNERAYTADSDKTPSERGPSVTANGPQTLPGAYQQSGAGCERKRVIGERLAGSTGRINLSSPCYNQNNCGPAAAGSPSKGSLFDAVSTRLENAKSNRKVLKDYSHAVYDNKAHNPEPVTPKEIRKQRRKEIQARFGKKAKIELQDSATDTSEKDGCTWTFVFDPAGRFSYWWSAVVSIAFIYNFWVIIYRFAFASEEINEKNLSTWFTLDYCADFIYVLDIIFHFRTGYLEDGVLQTDGVKLRIHYMNSTMFYIDCLCLLPLDILYLSIGFKSILRCFRLVKIYRFWAFLDRTERHTNYPNLVRTVTLLHYLFAIYHWNACVVYMVTRTEDNDSWEFPPEEANVFTQYLHSLYYSTLVLTTIGNLPQPRNTGEYVFVIAEFVFGLLLFSAVLGNVANIVTNISAARKDFQAKLDSVKTYMSLRRVPLRLQDRVIKWFDYLWLSKKSSDEEVTLSLLPDKLKAEIALHVHLDTLKRVEIFQNTEAGFLCELVLKLRPVLFSPGDYICRKGEVGKEMYIVNRGRLQVVADSGKTVLATLRPGSYFGEISILNMGNEGNRRTASVRSVGYSDLFMLSKKDLWDVLKDYPTARVRLEAIAQKRLAKYKKAPLEKVILPRSKSTPGLVESAGKIPLQVMLINRHNTLPSTLLTPQGSMDSNGDCSASASASATGSGTRSRLSSDKTRETDDGVARNSNRGNSADLTHSMTVSSITSYVMDNSVPRVSVGVSDGPRTMFSASPRPPGIATVNTPVSVVAPSAFRPVEAGYIGYHGLGPPVVNTVRASPVPFTDMLCANVTMTTQSAQLTLPSAGGYLAAAPVGAAISPVPSLSPFHRSFHTLQTGSNYSNSPSFLSTGSNTLPQMSTSPSVLHQFHGNVSPNQMSNLPYHSNFSPNQTTEGGSSVPDTGQNALLDEITRLRNRLQSLEKENNVMSDKLNKQQWEVENRLSEIEMHFCGSENSGSRDSSLLDDKSLHGNRESVI